MDLFRAWAAGVVTYAVVLTAVAGAVAARPSVLTDGAGAWVFVLAPLASGIAAGLGYRARPGAGAARLVAAVAGPAALFAAVDLTLRLRAAGSLRWGLTGVLVAVLLATVGGAVAARRQRPATAR
jgi:hypothetical protein